MPSPAHFGWAAQRLGLPRGADAPSVGAFVRLVSSAARPGGVPEGPMGAGDYGVVLEDTGLDPRPFLVQELTSGHIWSYAAAALERVPDEAVPAEVRESRPLGDGAYVTLVHDFRRHSDAGRGPLSLACSELAFGVVILASDSRLRVRSCRPPPHREWWYDEPALRKVNLAYVPEALRQRVRPGVGDYVALTRDYAEADQGASDGPLEPGNLGVVVGIRNVPDSQGGLSVPRFSVRACHNGIVHKYCEGALHLVVPQLLHTPKHIPSDAHGRVTKLRMELQLAEVGSTTPLRSQAPQAVPPGSARWLDRGALPVVPGCTYWLLARLTCEDDELMLAALKPRCWTLHAPTGVPGEFERLQPLPRSRLGVERWRQQGHEQWASLAAVADGVDGADGAGDAPPPPWYNAHEDAAFAVFEWDSSTTPLVSAAGGLTSLSFISSLGFRDVDDGAASLAPMRHELQLVTQTPAAAAHPGHQARRQPQRATVHVFEVQEQQLPGWFGASSSAPADGANGNSGDASSDSSSTHAGGADDANSDSGSGGGGGSEGDSDTGSDAGSDAGSSDADADDARGSDAGGRSSAAGSSHGGGGRRAGGTPSHSDAASGGSAAHEADRRSASGSNAPDGSSAAAEGSTQAAATVVEAPVTPASSRASDAGSMAAAAGRREPRTPDLAPHSAGGAHASSASSSSAPPRLQAPLRLATPGVRISTLMQQLHRQQESHSPLWVSGTDAAAELAAQAYAAAEECQLALPPPRTQRASSARE